MPSAGFNTETLLAVGAVVSMMRAFQSASPACIQAEFLAMAGNKVESGSSAA